MLKPLRALVPLQQPQQGPALSLRLTSPVFTATSKDEEQCMQTWHGVIAGSAPIWAFDGEEPPIDPNYFAKGVTYDTSIAAGAAPGCTATLRSAWAALVSLAERDGGAGVARASEALNICSHRKLNTTDDAYSVRGWAASAFDTMAMGNYPFESGYMLNGNGVLPPFPVRAACQALMDTYTEARAAVPLSPISPVRLELFHFTCVFWRMLSARTSHMHARTPAFMRVARVLGADVVSDMPPGRCGGF